METYIKEEGKRGDERDRQIETERKGRKNHEKIREQEKDYRK